MENYTSDKAITEKDEDAFQRYNFSKRIAETIVQRKNKDSIVFGIFGVWGEGKTSIINFIKKEIFNRDKDHIQIVFNPWRFPDETALLTSFFNSLAKNIKENIDTENAPQKKIWFKSIRTKWEKNKEPLKTDSETIGDLIQKYGKLAAIFGASDFAETIGKAISNVDIDVLKNRIEELLEKHSKKIVIYIDDIDRLDKNEIHSIFRLVKLTADFSHTTYILSFDKDMVAAAIGERFGLGDKNAGENFLEKIIQIPLYIPKAQPNALNNYFFRTLDNSLLSLNILLSDEDKKRFLNQFTTNISNRLTTPRLAVRYGNTLSFSLPLLFDEVNIVDLLLVEALKIFYPEHYKFIKNNPNYFIGTYNSIFDKDPDKEKIQSIKNHLSILEESLHENEKQMVKNLLIELFPTLRKPFNGQDFYTHDYENWYVDKRIASSEYFERYFTYAVIEGDISDIEFSDLLEKISKSKSIEKIIDDINILIKKTSFDIFTKKISMLKNKYDWELTKRISKMICLLSEELPSEDDFSFTSPQKRASMLIFNLLENYKDSSELFEFSKKLMLYPKSFSFAYHINNWLRSGDLIENKLLTINQYEELAKVLTKRAINEAGNKTIYMMFEKHLGFLTAIFNKHYKEKFDLYVKKFLDTEKTNILFLLKAHLPTITSSRIPHIYKGDLSEQLYDFLQSMYNLNDFYRRIISIESYNNLENRIPQWDSFEKYSYSDENMVIQFFHWYKLKQQFKEM